MPFVFWLYLPLLIERMDWNEDEDRN